MCGRYATTRNSTALTAFFEAVDETEGAVAPDYNVAPTDPVPIVRMSDRLGSRVLSVARWGLVPSWATDPKIGARMINARAETVATSNAYARSFTRRRCLVPADGWYEWVRQNQREAAPGAAASGAAATAGGGRRSGARQPYFMTFRDGAPVVFAGLWTVYGNGQNKRLSCGIITSPAVGELRGVHHRMPLLLPVDRWSAWLSGPPDPALLEPTPESLVSALELRPVSPAVGDVRNDGPELIEPVSVAPGWAAPGSVGLADAVGEVGDESQPLRLF